MIEWYASWDAKRECHKYSFVWKSRFLELSKSDVLICEVRPE